MSTPNAAGVPSPDPERRQLVADTMFQAWQDAPPDRNVWDYVAERVLDVTSASPDPEADDGTVNVKLPREAVTWFASDADDDDGRLSLSLVADACRAALAALEEGSPGEDIDGQ